ncbi:MAG TPA: hypothetical protein VFD27_13400, partial [Chthoniobacteraceae bacterium]|nr:hypothetical protein [Chthoniobacteraceae bacterium]
MLGLTDVQVREIAAARDAMENDDAVRAARGVSKSDPQREQARETVEAATARLRERVATILTAEQRALIDKINGLHAAAVEETAILYGPRFGTVKNDEAARLRLQE